MAKAETCGLLCPKCNKPIDTSLIAKSFKQPGGVLRIRYCKCHAEVCTFEQVLPIGEDNYLVVNGIKKSSDVGTIRGVVEALGGTILNRKRYG